MAPDFIHSSNLIKRALKDIDLNKTSMIIYSDDLFIKNYQTLQGD